MSAILFEPHLDDAVLFACYTLLRERPKVVTVFGNSQVQEPAVTGGERVEEEGRAFAMLGGLDWELWPFSDMQQANVRFATALIASVEHFKDYDVAWAPLPEPAGHAQHNTVGYAVREVFGDRARFYCTYERGSGRSRDGMEVEPQPGWHALKFAAMSCYSSQINLENCRPWFSSHDMLREWIA